METLPVSNQSTPLANMATQTETLKETTRESPRAIVFEPTLLPVVEAEAEAEAVVLAIVVVTSLAVVVGSAVTDAGPDP